MNFPPPDPAEVADALRAIPADDRSLWVRVGMALMAALGPEAESLFLEWSSTSERYRESSARSTWRSFHPHSITPNTLFFIARQHGWHPSPNLPPQPPIPRPTRTDSDRAEKQRRQKARRAADEAAIVVRRATLERHPYLERKGLLPTLPEGAVFPDETPYASALVRNGRLIVPLRTNWGRGEIVAYQAIASDGSKKTLPGGCSLRGAWHVIGAHWLRASHRWIVEGYATARSIHLALAGLGRRDDSVLVALSASRLPTAALETPSRLRPATTIFADSDPAGMAAAASAERRTGVRHIASETAGEDANDLHQRMGLHALGDFLLRRIAAQKAATPV